MKQKFWLGLGIAFLGILLLAYQGFSYTRQETTKIETPVGDLKISAPDTERVYVPPLVSGAVLAVGVVLMVLGYKRDH